MAPLRKKSRSLYRFVCFTVPDERRGQWVARQSDRRKAQKRFGEAQARKVNPSLHHTTISLLKNASASAVVAMDIIGHNSKAVSRLYTHVDEDARRRAIAGLPDIFSVAPSVGPGREGV